MKGNLHVRFWSRVRAAMPALRHLSVAMIHLLARKGRWQPRATDPAQKCIRFRIAAQVIKHTQYSNLTVRKKVNHKRVVWIGEDRLRLIQIRDMPCVPAPLRMARSRLRREMPNVTYWGLAEGVTCGCSAPPRQDGAVIPRRN